MNRFDDLVAEFLANDKEASFPPRWRTGAHPDYAEATTVISSPESRLLRGRLILAAHRVRTPAKYCFSVLFRGQRVLGLDTNPGRAHRNIFQPKSVCVTHWQQWPKMDEALADARELNFQGWLKVFMRQANILDTFRISSPPQGVQLRMKLELPQWRR